MYKHITYIRTCTIGTDITRTYINTRQIYKHIRTVTCTDVKMSDVNEKNEKTEPEKMTVDDSKLSPSGRKHFRKFFYYYYIYFNTINCACLNYKLTIFFYVKYI